MREKKGDSFLQQKAERAEQHNRDQARERELRQVERAIREMAARIAEQALRYLERERDRDWGWS